MDRLDHDIVQDLLPLYHDGVCSERSRAAVEAHLQTCETCRACFATRTLAWQSLPTQAMLQSTTLVTPGWAHNSLVQGSAAMVSRPAQACSPRSAGFLPASRTCRVLTTRARAPSRSTTRSVP